MAFFFFKLKWILWWVTSTFFQVFVVDLIINTWFWCLRGFCYRRNCIKVETEDSSADTLGVDITTRGIKNGCNMFSDSHWLKSPIVTIMKTFFARRLDDKINDLIVLKTTTVPLIPAGLKGNWFRSERNHELIPNTQKICACMNFQTYKDPVLLLSTKLNKCLCGLVVAV